MSGQITHKDAIKLAQSFGLKNWTKESWVESKKKASETRMKKGYTPSWNKGLTKDQDLRLQEASERAKIHMKQGKIHCIGDYHRGKNLTNSHKKSLSDAAKNRSKVKCEHCEKEVIPQMYSRWHGDKCRSKRG